MTTLEKQYPEVHSKLTRQADAEKLFKSFMKMMGTSKLHFSGEIDTKLKELYQDGKRYGFE
jgi:hypothetical protein|tara:strand:+ start:257 stop:439 length:183 start_codon:yes stop_codon:yes gene_type:complete